MIRPVDGMIVEGYGFVDQAAITGESLPVEKRVGDAVISATTNKNGSFKFEAQKVGEDTTGTRWQDLHQERRCNPLKTSSMCLAN